MLRCALKRQTQWRKITVIYFKSKSCYGKTILPNSSGACWIVCFSLPDTRWQVEWGRDPKLTIAAFDSFQSIVLIHGTYPGCFFYLLVVKLECTCFNRNETFFKFSSFGFALEALRHLIQQSELVSARFKLVYALIFIALLGG